jgi:hypothetical protein
MDLDSPRRYVVLHHTGYGEPHFDFMIAVDDISPLRTWRSPVWPIDRRTPPQPLPDHRRVYLTYEGPVSNGRGHVRRVAEGVLRIEHSDEASMTIALDEQRITIFRTVKS